MKDRQLPLALVNGAIDAALDYDPGSRIALDNLAGHSLCLECLRPSLRLNLLVNQRQVKLIESIQPDRNHCHISVSSLAGLLDTLQRQHVFGTAAVTVSGNASTLAQWQHLYANIDLDWEELLCQQFGDLLDHSAAEALRGLGDWCRQRGQRLRHHGWPNFSREQQTLLARGEADNFYHAVNTLRLDVDRLRARLQHIKQQLAQRQPSATQAATPGR